MFFYKFLFINFGLIWCWLPPLNEISLKIWGFYSVSATFFYKLNLILYTVNAILNIYYLILNTWYLILDTWYSIFCTLNLAFQSSHEKKVLIQRLPKILLPCWMSCDHCSCQIWCIFVHWMSFYILMLIFFYVEKRVVSSVTFAMLQDLSCNIEGFCFIGRSKAES